MEEISTEILIVVLVVVLMVLLILFWIIRLYKNRNLTELSIYAKQPALRLSIKTKPDDAEQLLGYILDRLFPSGENRLNPEEDPEGPSDPDPATNQPNKTLDTFRQRLSQWTKMTLPLKQHRQKDFSAESPDIPTATNQDQASCLPLQHASSSGQGGSCEVEKQHDETHL